MGSEAPTLALKGKGDGEGGGGGEVSGAGSCSGTGTRSGQNLAVVYMEALEVEGVAVANMVVMDPVSAQPPVNIV